MPPGYDSSILAGSTSSPRIPPRKPTIRSVALPETNSPVASRSSAGVHDHPTRFPSFRGQPKLHRSTTPAPARTQLRDPHIHEPASHRVRTSSMSSNSSDKPLKGILKNSSSRSTTPAPPPTVAPGNVEPSYSKPKRKISLSEGIRISGYTSSSGSSKVDGYYSDASHAHTKKRHSPDDIAPSSTYDVSKMYSEKPAQHGKATPIKVPMKPEVISLNWPLLEYRPSRSRERRLRVCFDIAFDPRLAKGVRVPESGHLVDMNYDDIRMPASNHCTVTEMRIAVMLDKMEYWAINVERKKGIRCIDVFEAIYKTYHMQLTKRELQTIGLTEYNIKEGMRRVDLLRGRRFFKGLTQQGSGWVLHLDEYHSG